MQGGYSRWSEIQNVFGLFRILLFNQHQLRSYVVGVAFSEKLKCRENERMGIKSFKPSRNVFLKKK